LALYFSVLYNVSMEQTFRANHNVTYVCHYHVVFCPKYRRKVLVKEVDERLKQIIREVCTEHDAIVEEMEVMPDHVHLLLNVDPQYGIHRLVKLIKGRSSRYLRQEYRQLKTRMPTLWTNSYLVITTGTLEQNMLADYLEKAKRI